MQVIGPNGRGMGCGVCVVCVCVMCVEITDNYQPTWIFFLFLHVLDQFSFESQVVSDHNIDQRPQEWFQKVTSRRFTPTMCRCVFPKRREYTETCWIDTLKWGLAPLIAKQNKCNSIHQVRYDGGFVIVTFCRSRGLGEISYRIFQIWKTVFHPKNRRQIFTKIAYLLLLWIAK